MIASRPFGRHEGRPVTCYRLESRAGYVEFLDFGCMLRSLCVRDAAGVLTDVTLGFDDMAGYAADEAHIGGTIGRVAGRIGGARFTLGNRAYALVANEADKCLHGGACFDRRMWTLTPEGDALIARYTSPDGEGGFPGRLDVTVRICFSDAGALILHYMASADQRTPVSLTNHAYFNLLGEGSVLTHTLTLNADAITPLDAALLPTGTFMPVADTPFDFRTPKPLGQDIRANHPQLHIGGGYDHNFVLRDAGLRLAGTLGAENGLCMRVYTDAPCVQLYTANFLSPARGKNGRAHGAHTAVCLETQGYPNAVNIPAFPGVFLEPGGVYRTTTIYEFFHA